MLYSHIICTKALQELTQNVLDSGVVLTYGKLLGYNPIIWPTTQVSMLPINVTYKIGTIIMTDVFSANATAGNVKIRFVNDQNYYGSISTAHQFRVIIIPGGQKAGRSKQLTYEEICKKYNLAE